MPDVVIQFTMINNNTITWEMSHHQWRTLEGYMNQGCNILSLIGVQKTYYVVLQNVVSFIVTKN